MKKVFKFFVFGILLSCLTAFVTVSAAGKLNYNTQAIKSHTPIVSTDLFGVATLNQSAISTYNGRVISENKLAVHQTSWVELNTSIKDSNIRVVNYTSGSATHWQGKKPSELAAIYEKENPGWIVVAGINGDFFHISDNDEICGTSMQEGDFYKSYKWDTQGHMALGFFDDGSYITGIVEATSNEYVQILKNDGSYEDVCEIKAIDKAPVESGVSLLTRYDITTSPYAEVDVLDTALDYDLSDYKVYTITYETQRLDRGTKKVFVKGIVTDITTNQKTYKINDPDNVSYLVCKDGSLDTLQIGDEIRCQCKTTGNWEGVSNITMAYNQVLKNGNVVDYANITDVNTGYVNCNKNRTVMGFKVDGSPMFMSIEKGTYGAAYEECGEILKAAGCEQGFLFDGGGSACLFVRTEQGTFKTINKQEDGNERSDGNAVFFVMRDPGFKAKVESVDRFSATVKLDVTNQTYFGEVSNIKVKIGDKTVAYKDGGVKVEGLNENTAYTAIISYDMKKHNDPTKTVTAYEQVSFETKDFVFPEPGLSVVGSTHDTISVKKDMSLSTASWITDVIVHIGDSKFEMGNKETFDCTELYKDVEYDVYFEYTIVDPASDKTYTLTTEPVKVKTKAFCVPTIIKFEEGRKSSSSVTIAYEYLDEDKVVENAYILVNGENVKEISTKSGNTTITGLDFENESYEIKLVIEYLDEAEKVIKVESDTLEYKVVTPEPKPEPAKPKGGCGKKGVELFVSLMAASAVIGILLRKRK
ncbi:MAG: phosphodiester glycosidase family protein [Bacilli bacterium]|nr:phosphodiester glycosidase family protein [Bacilli bacterium]